MHPDGWLGPESRTNDDLIAFVDESMRVSPAGGLYLVTAAVVVSRDRSAVEHRLRTATGQRRHRIHWRNESEGVRFNVLDSMASQPMRGLSAVVEPAAPRRQERARSQAWWSLVWHLVQAEVTELVIEARQEQLNRRDRLTIATIQRAGIGRNLRYRFGLPSEEPALWAADALAGAIGVHLATGDCRYVERLPAHLTELHRVAG